MKRGTLIAIEGIDGAGKSSQAKLLADALRAAGHSVIQTREPTDGPDGRRIRELSMRGAELEPKRELELFMADRRRHAREVLTPGLESGAVVLTDRYFLSSAAYQGARGLDPQRILEDNEAEFPIPDLVLLLAVSVADGLKRVGLRGAPRNLAFEKEDFLARVSRTFDALDRPYIERIPTGPDLETVHEKVLGAVRSRLGGVLSARVGLRKRGGGGDGANPADDLVEAEKDGQRTDRE